MWYARHGHWRAVQSLLEILLRRCCNSVNDTSVYGFVTTHEKGFGCSNPPRIPPAERRRPYFQSLHAWFFSSFALPLWLIDHQTTTITVPTPNKQQLDTAAVYLRNGFTTPLMLSFVHVCCKTGKA